MGVGRSPSINSVTASLFSFTLLIYCLSAADYLFKNAKGKRVCGAKVAVMKEYHINRYEETEHLDKYKVEEELQKVEEMKMSLVSGYDHKK